MLPADWHPLFFPWHNVCWLDLQHCVNSWINTVTVYTAFGLQQYFNWGVFFEVRHPTGKNSPKIMS